LLYVGTIRNSNLYFPGFNGFLSEILEKASSKEGLNDKKLASDCFGVGPVFI